MCDFSASPAQSFIPGNELNSAFRLLPTTFPYLGSCHWIRGPHSEAGSLLIAFDRTSLVRLSLLPGSWLFGPKRPKALPDSKAMSRPTAAVQAPRRLLGFCRVLGDDKILLFQ